MSSVPIEPEISTASIRSRPLVGSSIGSPIHSGLTPASTNRHQMMMSETRLATDLPPLA